MHHSEPQRRSLEHGSCTLLKALAPSTGADINSVTQNWHRLCVDEHLNYLFAPSDSAGPQVCRNLEQRQYR